MLISVQKKQHWLSVLSLAIQLSLFITTSGGICSHAAAQTPSIRNYQIPSGDLSTALLQFAAQSGSQLTVDYQKIKGLKTAGLSGEYGIEAGFNQLLAQSPYRIAIKDQSFILIERNTLKPHAQPIQLASIDVTTVHSASEENTTQLPAIEVQASEAAYLPTQVNIGKMNQKLKEIPQSVSVITRQQLEDRNATTLEDAMRYATGISAYGNTNGGDYFYSRNGTVNYQFNGVPSSAQNQFDLAAYEQIEVLRGPNGLLSGSGNPTGTINLVRKRALDHFQAQLSSSIGSWNNYHSEVDINSPLNAEGSLRGRAIVVAENREYFYDHADSHKLMSSGILEYDLSDATTVGISATLQQVELTPFSGFPGDDRGNLLALSRSSNLDAKYNKTTRDTWEVMADLKHQFNAHWQLTTTLRYYQAEYDELSGNPRVAVNSSTGEMGFEQWRGEYDYENISGDIHLNADYTLLGQKQELLLGANYNRAWNEGGSSSLSDFYSTDWYHAPYANASDIPAISSKSENKTTQTGLYGMLRLKPIKALTVVLGTRFSDYSNKYRDSWPEKTAWTQGAKETGEFTPYAGLVWDFFPSTSWYISYADVFIPQTTKDYYGVVLEPKVGWQAETGFKGEFFDGRLNSSIAVFRIREENAAITDPDPTHNNCGDTGTSQCSIADGLTETEGWEVEIVGRLLPGLDLSAGYTHSKKTPIRQNGSVGSANASGTNNPQDVFKLWANYKFQPEVLDGRLEGLSIGTGIYAVGETYGWGYTDYHLRQGGYTTVALQVGYQFNKNLSANLTVNNVFDKTYYHQLNDERSYNVYGEPRNFMLTVRFKYW
jgi:outer membrane receptor for ferric coprogen and ferric-rhodotorulic acid